MASRHEQAGERQLTKQARSMKTRLNKSIVKDLAEMRGWLGVSGSLPPALAVTVEECSSADAIVRSGEVPWQCVPATPTQLSRPSDLAAHAFREPSTHCSKSGHGQHARLVEQCRQQELIVDRSTE